MSIKLKQVKPIQVIIKHSFLLNQKPRFWGKKKAYKIHAVAFLLFQSSFSTACDQESIIVFFISMQNNIASFWSVLSIKLVEAQWMSPIKLLMMTKEISKGANLSLNVLACPSREVIVFWKALFLIYCQTWTTKVHVSNNPKLIKLI